jgi:dTDP-4-amino-4,6-dideoxygalactose transaminase
VVRAGLKPVASDVDVDQWLLTAQIAKGCLSTTSFAAVIPVATFGVPVPSKEWDQFFLETGIPVLLDAAAAYGNQRDIGNMTAVFSMHATKPLAAGEGGLVVSHSLPVIEQVRRLSNFGINLGDMPGFGLGVVPQSGTNAKLSEYHAAIGLASLDAWPVSAARRLAVAHEYIDALQPWIQSGAVSLQSGSESIVRSTLCVRFASANLCDAVKHALISDNIDFRVWYTPLICDHPAFAHSGIGKEPVYARQLSARLLGLPFYLKITRAQIQRVVNAIAKAVNADSNANDYPNR